MPRTVAVTNDNSSQDRSCSGGCSRSSTSWTPSSSLIEQADSVIGSGSGLPTADAVAQHGRSHGFHRRSRRRIGGGGQVRGRVSVGACTDSAKSRSSCVARRRKSTTVISRPVPSGSPGSSSLRGSRPSHTSHSLAPAIGQPEIVGGYQCLVPGWIGASGSDVRSVELGVALAKQAKAFS